MEITKLVGYTRPEGFPGKSDAVKIQKALNEAESEDVRKVVFHGQYTVDSTLYIPTQTELVFEAGTVLTYVGEGPLFTNRVANEPDKASWSFEDSLIYLKGAPGARLTGDLSFYHARYVVLEQLEIEGNVSFEFCREVRMEDDVISSPATALTVSRGCNNFILQRLTLKGGEAAVRIDAALAKGPYVTGKDADVHELIFKDSVLDGDPGIQMCANETDGIFNVQIDHLKVTGDGLVIGEGSALPKERFFNLTAEAIETKKTAVLLKNETKHCFFPEQEK